MENSERKQWLKLLGARTSGLSSPRVRCRRPPLNTVSGRRRWRQRLILPRLPGYSQAVQRSLHFPPSAARCLAIEAVLR